MILHVLHVKLRQGMMATAAISFSGCTPECRFYPETRRIEDDEVIMQYEKQRKERDERTRSKVK
jgi:hypothetical protein